MIIAAVLVYAAWQNRRREHWVTTTDNILLLVEVPKDNEKKELSAEQMFASLHGILRPQAELQKEGSLQEHVSFEIVSRANSIQFYIWTPKHLKDFVESQVYAQYPTVQIKEGPADYSRVEVGNRIIYGTELGLTKDTVMPIKTFASFEVDPLAGITGVLAKMEQMGEECWIQILARPVDDSWHEQGHTYIEAVKGGAKKTWGNSASDILLQIPIFIFTNFFMAIFAPPAPADKKTAEKKELSTGQQAVLKAVEEKSGKLGYQVKIRIAYLGPDEVTAKHRMQAIVGGFKQFNTTNLNGFSQTKTYNSPAFLEDYQARLFFDSGYVLNIEELASLYHMPHKAVETPSMVWTTTKISEPPSNIPVEGSTEPQDVSLFALSNFRGRHLKFGIKRKDRGRHLYIIGQTGAGKSFLLQLLTLSDIYHDVGFAIVDPHGDLCTDAMKYIPEHRLGDVIYFNPADRDFPMAFNPMEVSDPAMKDHISSELVGVLKRMFDSWGPRLEYILRYTLLALLDYPECTMLDIPRMLTEKGFRKKVIAHVQDPVVRSFWVTEFASWNEKFASEAVAPVLNKVGAFVANPLVRNIIGQKKSAFNIREIMDGGKILLCNLSRGQVGEDNAAILGSLMVTKIQLAAMSRADMPLDQRRPFYLYVDEFQNFATDSFAVILSEARKYGLNLTVANQYVSQMPEVVRDAVFGNVGTMISFRIGPGDSTILGKYFEPVFEAADLTKLHNQNIFISMIINGEKAPPFSGTTLRMPDPERDLTPTIIQLTRQQYASQRDIVETDIRARTEDGGAGAQALGAIDDQRPNKDFLTALKNPNLPGAPRTERSYATRNDSRGDNRGERRDGGERSGFRSGNSAGPRRDGGRDGGRGDSRDSRPRQQGGERERSEATTQQHSPAPAYQPAPPYKPQAAPSATPAAGAPTYQQPPAPAQGAQMPPQSQPVPTRSGATIEPGQPVSFR